MSSEYKIWLHKVEKKACDVVRLIGFDEGYRLARGESLKADWPSEAYFNMNVDRPENALLMDALFNISSLVIVSKHLRNFLLEWEIAGLELLPVGLKDHSGELIEDPYYVLNLASHFDCLDSAKSSAKKSLVPGKYSSVEKLVLKNLDLTKSSKLFRLKNYGIPTIVSNDLAAAIDDAGFTGVRWGELKDYSGDSW